MKHWTREEFLFCYQALKRLWNSTTKEEIKASKKDLKEARYFYKSQVLASVVK